MGSLCSVFDVKKQGKPIREVQTRHWKLREEYSNAEIVLKTLELSRFEVSGFMAGVMGMTLGTMMLTWHSDSELRIIRTRRWMS
ncbi:hypothetical protein GQ457_01G030250 [Hibiscus cannabinus]